MTQKIRLISVAKSLAASAAFVLAAGLAGLSGGVTPARAADVLIICANEGGTCIAPNANTTITYGKNGAVKTTIGVTQIGCSNSAFGGDPLAGESKTCTYTINPQSVNWTQCAEEGKTCNFSGAKLVRYGAGNNWVYGSFVTQVNCSNDTFGDPAANIKKTCQVSN